MPAMFQIQQHVQNATETIPAHKLNQTSAKYWQPPWFGPSQCCQLLYRAGSSKELSERTAKKKMKRKLHKITWNLNVDGSLSKRIMKWWGLKFRFTRLNGKQQGRRSSNGVGGMSFAAAAIMLLFFFFFLEHVMHKSASMACLKEISFLWGIILLGAEGSRAHFLPLASSSRAHNLHVVDFYSS